MYYSRLNLREQGQTWKNWISDFSDCILNANVGEFHDTPLLTHSAALEIVASENTLSRAQLTEKFLKKFKEVPTRARSATTINSACHPDRIYVFLFFPSINLHSSEEEYRNERFAYMQLYGLVSRLKFTKFSKIIIIGSTTRGMKRSSETILVIDASMPLSEKEKRDVEKIMKQYSIFNDTRKTSTNNSRHISVKADRSFLYPRRNDACPCHSGKKYKKCCIEKYFK